jgi:hypothetical protein
MMDRALALLRSLLFLLWMLVTVVPIATAVLLASIVQQVPGTQLHAVLCAFADAHIKRERELRGYVGDVDSPPSRAG